MGWDSEPLHKGQFCDLEVQSACNRTGFWLWAGDTGNAEPNRQHVWLLHGVYCLQTTSLIRC